MQFREIPGLQDTKAQLIRSIRSGKIPHAQLFEGVEGTLNFPLARAYAAYLHCQQRTETDSCGTCTACVKSLKYIHPDTHFVFPSGSLKSDKDEDRARAERQKSWRAFLIENPFGTLSDWIAYNGVEDKQVSISRDESREIIRTLALKPFESPFKIMLIWQPEMMHPSAANGILKILEEPPPNTVFLLVTNHAESLLPTVVSRTQRVHVPLLSDIDLEAFLSAHTAVDTQKRSKVVQQAEGNLAVALALSENEEEDHHYETFTEWMRACFKKDYARMVGLAEEFHELDKLNQRGMLHYSLNMLREVLLQVSGASEINRARGNELKFARDFSSVMTASKIEKASLGITDATYHLERNGSAKMIFLDLSLALSKTLNP